MSIKSLYTQTLPKDMAATVRGIPAPEGCEAFQGHPTSYDEGAQRWTQWVEAWQDPQTKLWTIEEHKRFSGGEAASRKHKIISKNACFFDALYCCGYEEVARKSGGAHITETADDIVHYSMAADKAYQPLDMIGVPHPAAHGRILTEGEFDDAAYATASKTRTVKLIESKASAAPRLIDFDQLAAGQISSPHATKMIRDKELGKQFAVTKFRTAVEAAKDFAEIKKKNLNDPSFVKEILSDITPTVFAWKGGRRPATHAVGYLFTAFAAVLSILSAETHRKPLTAYMDDVAVWGLGITALATMAPTVWRASRSLANNLLASTNLTNKIAALPDCALKTEIKAHRAMIKASDHFAKAAKIFNTHGCKSKWHLHRAFRQVNKGARIAGMSKPEAEQLRMALVEGNFPSICDIHNKVETARYRLSEAINRMEQQIESAEDIKALEHNEEVPVDFMATKIKSYTP